MANDLFFIQGNKMYELIENEVPAVFGQKVQFKFDLYFFTFQLALDLEGLDLISSYGDPKFSDWRREKEEEWTFYRLRL